MMTSTFRTTSNRTLARSHAQAGAAREGFWPMTASGKADGTQPMACGGIMALGFDLKFGVRLAGAVGEPVATDAAGKGPICLYRWMTSSKNGSGMGEAAMMSSQPNYEGPKIRVPDPEFDAETADYYSEFGNIVLPSTCCGG
jgi:hypothetical protein